MVLSGSDSPVESSVGTGWSRDMVDYRSDAVRTNWDKGF